MIIAFKKSDLQYLDYNLIKYKIIDELNETVRIEVEINNYTLLDFFYAGKAANLFNN